MTEPWERIEGESNKAFRAFTAFRDLLPEERSIRKALVKLWGPKADGRQRTAEGWSSQWRWQERAAAWDDHLDKTKVEAKEESIKEVERAHAEAAKKMWEQGLSWMDGLSAEDITAQDVRTFIVEGIKLQRLSMGMSTECVHQEVNENVKVAAPPQMTTAELKEVLEFEREHPVEQRRPDEQVHPNQAHA